MAIPIINNWQKYFVDNDEGLGSSYERIIINNKLLQITRLFNLKSVLEAPVFGFTGISGINSFALARHGLDVHLIDHCPERIEMIKTIWQNLAEQVDITYLKDYKKFPFPEKKFDLVWNFSALWFVDDLPLFLSEFTRVCKKVVFICVPNRSGLGYLSQKYSGKKDLKTINEENIIPCNIIKIMNSLNWTLLQKNYIDCPPWPDIGMSKENFLQKFNLGWLFPPKSHKTISIIDYYDHKNPNFPEQMLKHYWFERYFPDFIKIFWAHHQYLLFIPKK